ncbi:MAG: hypothetical protein OXI87_05995 [Albidovulum sp.]|nr:hypothetical protein [Albidovulum sp.]MDE0304422.1 hypothetical protein [Albidovulum sp.]MDE0533207.1 hypothetical protein [Albidovulum sp.]
MAIKCAGIDVGKEFAEVHLACEDRSFEKDRSSYRAIAGFLRKHSASSVAVEATGRMHRELRRPERPKHPPRLYVAGEGRKLK